MTEEKKLSINEKIKTDSLYLKGTLRETVANQSVDHFSSNELQLIKFHGFYEQDNRDDRSRLIKEGKGKSYSMMIRSKVPGGFMNAEQYLAHDKIADEFGLGQFRITDRQGIQFHGVLKKNIKGLLQALNRVKVTTIGACGDVVRNVMAPAAPFLKYQKHGLLDYTQKVSDQFLWKSGTYAELWLDGEKVDLSALEPEKVEPIYGRTYLPRKFKIAMAFPGDNSVDVYAHDIGIVPEIVNDKLTGFNILVGGGMGMTHGVTTTYPRVATPLCFVKPEELLDITKAIVIAQRDLGNRADRKNARLKYTIDRLGEAKFREEVEKRFGKKTEDIHPFTFKEIEHYHGWHDQGDGKWFLGVFVQNGRVKDEGTFKLRTALRTIVEKWKCNVALTPEQDILLSGFTSEQKPEVEQILTSHGVKLPESWGTVHKHSIACPALPTCGLAISESERSIPAVLDEIDANLKSLGLGEEKISIRMTGCPNGCARPYTSEIGFVGKTAGTYNIYLAGSHLGNRLNQTFQEKVLGVDLAKRLKPVFELYKSERQAGERFGDFCHRKGITTLQSLTAGV
ncbi:MAG TPA: NADPH-dependent assimilatory sulfite reductase hemoprotein subunit [Candidatus Omnitrophica bacterium]|nr:NADPH-dependent assimilatory sulfite reductase hemoprotein subunit [Candidatus Omnitrophota bacterium]